MDNIINALKELEQHSEEYGILIEYIDCVWYMCDYEVFWNTDNNKRDLYVSDGETYAGDIKEGVVETDSYFFINVDMQQGVMITCIFDKNKQLEYDDLENEFD